jgi:hypothetical protein
VYFGFGSIIGNTFVSDAAAYTVGAEPEEVDEDFLLLPHPAARPAIATTAAAVATSFVLIESDTFDSLTSDAKILALY